MDKKGTDADYVTALDYLDDQKRLEEEARTLMPFDPNQCTYVKGELRQPVFACLTCSKQNLDEPIGVCYSCSIQCHSTHELIELFSKRNFVCDCGTTKMSKTPRGACKLRSHSTTNNHESRSRSGSFGSFNRVQLEAEDIPSLSNTYNQNYQGLFCSCLKPYNPLVETGNMIQCFFGYECGEDWYHEECILGYDRVNGGASDGECILHALTEAGEEAANDILIKREEKEIEVKKEETSNTNYFPDLEQFDVFICWKCVEKFRDIFKEIKDQTDIVHCILPHIEAKSREEWETLYLDLKENNEEKINENDKKRRKLNDLSIQKYSYSYFLNNTFKEVLSNLAKKEPANSKLSSFLHNYDFLYKDDPIYEPPEEDDRSSGTGSLLDLGAEALNTLPKDQAIEGLRAYDMMKAKLTSFFKPFAEEGKVVTENEVRDFFNKIKDEEK